MGPMDLPMQQLESRDDRMRREMLAQMLMRGNSPQAPGAYSSGTGSTLQGVAGGLNALSALMMRYPASFGLTSSTKPDPLAMAPNASMAAGLPK